MKNTTAGPRAFVARALAWITTALVVIPAIFLSTPQAANAATGSVDSLSGAVSSGLIETSPGNPILKVDTTYRYAPHPFANQITAPDPLGTAFYEQPTNNQLHSMVKVRTVGSGSAEHIQNNPSDDFGGTGTVADPLWTSETMESANYRVTKKESYTLGAGYVQTDLSVTNLTASAKTASVGYAADCKFAGTDTGYSAVTAGQVATCQTEVGAGYQMSLVAASPGATLEVGGYTGVFKQLELAEPFRDDCVTGGVNSPSLAGPEHCSLKQDNGFGIKFMPWIDAGATSTHTYFTTYGESMLISDLVFDLKQNHDAIREGGSVEYTLSTTNDGPTDAKNTQAAFKVPAGLQFDSYTGDGVYDAVNGTWTMGDLPVGETQTIKIKATAPTEGKYTAGITNGTSTSLDLSACSPGSLENCGPRVELEVTKSPVNLDLSTIVAVPDTITADGVETSTVTVTLRDDNGDVVTTAPGAVVEMLPSLGSVGSVTNNGDGTYTAQVSSTVAGAATVGFTVDGGTGTQTAPLTFVAGAVSQAESSLVLSTGERVANGADAHTAVATLRDANGNPVIGIAGDVSLAADPSAGVTLGAFAETSPGVYTASITSTVAGTIGIEGLVQVAGSPLSIGAGDVLFGAGDVDVTNEKTAFTVSTGSQPVDTGSHTVTATLADANGNPVSNRAGDLLAEASASLGGGVITAFAETGTAGQYTANVTSTVVGTFPIEVTVSGETVSLLTGGNPDAVFGPGGVDLGNDGTNFTVSDGVQPVETGSHEVTVKLVDKFGHSVSGEAAELSARTAVVGAGLISGFVETGTPGTYTASVTSTLAGDHQVVVAYKGGTVNLATGGNDLARFSAGPVDPTNPGTAFTVSLGDQVVGETPHTVTVTLADKFGNLVSGQADDVNAASTGNGVVGSFTESSTQPGEYTAEITSESIGKKTITVTFLGENVGLQVAAPGIPAGNDIASFVAGVVDPSHANTYYSVSEGSVPVGTGEHEVTVRLSDRFGNPVTGQEAVSGQPELLLAAIDPALEATVSSFAATATAGEYRAVVKSNLAGVKPVTATWDGTALNGRGNTDAEFAPGEVDLSHDKSRFVVTDDERVVGVETHEVTATLADRFGNPVSGQAADLTAATTAALGSAGYVTGFTSTGAGSYTAQVASTVAGVKPMLASYKGDAITPGGNQNAVFIAGDIDLNHADTSFDVSGGPVSVDGGSHLVTARLADKFGNPVTLADTSVLGAATVDALGGGSFSAFAATVEPGVYTATVTSTVSGDKTVTATVNGDALTLKQGGNDIARFISGGVDPNNGNTFYSVSTGAQVVGETPHTVTVSLADAQGNAVSGAEAGIQALIAGDLGAGKLGDFAETGTAGIYEASLSSTIAGVKPVTISFGGDQLRANGNAEALFDAGAVDLTNSGSSYAVSTGTVPVSTGSETHTITSTLADKYGNPVPGQESLLAAAAAPGIGGGAISAFAETATGNYEATISSTVAGIQQVTATFDGADISLNGNNGDARFSPADVDLANAGTRYTVSTGDRIVGSEEHRVAVTLADEFGNPVPGRAGELTAASAATLGSGAISAFTESSTTPGSYSAQISSTSAGAKLITAQFNTGEITLLAGGNDTATFVAGDVDLGNLGTAFTVTDDSRVVGVDEHVASVTLADRYGNPVSGKEAALSAASAQTLGSGGISAFTAGATPGSYTATIASTVAGDKLISTEFEGAAITLLVGGNDLARFTAGDVDYGHPDTGFTVTDDERVAGVETHSVTATLADTYGNPVSGQEGDLLATAAESLGSGSIDAFTASATVPGSYSASISSTLAGDKQIAVELDGTTVSLLSGGNDIARFIAGDVDLTHDDSTYVVSDGPQTVGVGVHTVTATLVDAFGNGVSGQDTQLAGIASALGSGFVSGFVDLGAGSYQATVTSTIAGIKPVTVNYGGAPVIAPASANTDALFVAGDVDLGHELTGYSVTDTEELVGTGVHTVTIQLADSFGNPVGGKQGDLVALASDLGAGTVASVTETGVAGTYSATITSTVSGVKPVTVELAGAALAALDAGNANTDAVFIAGDVDLGHDGTNFVVSEGEVSIETGQHSVTVRLADSFGNPVPGAASELKAATADALGTGVIGAFDEDPAHAGTYVAPVTSTVAGNKTITATFAGDAVSLARDASGDPENDIARFIPGGVDVGNSGTRYTVTTGDRVAGVETHTVKVTLADSFGNPVAGQAAGVNAASAESLGAGEITPFTETAQPGTYEATISSTLAGTKAITAVFGGSPIERSGNANAVFVAGEVDLTRSGSAYAVSTGEQVVGTGKHTVTVTLVDAFDNPVGQQASELNASAPSLGAGAIGSFTESVPVPGTYTADARSTIAGVKPVTVKHAGNDVSAEAAANTDAVFVAGDVDLTHEDSGYKVTTGSEFVGTGRHTVTVQLVDMFGNPVDGKAFGLAADTVEDLGSGVISSVTESATLGTYEATVTSTVAGSKPMTATFNGASVSALTGANTVAKFTATDVDLTHPNTTYVVTDTEEIVGTGQHTVTATLADEFGNPVSGQAVELTAAAAELGGGLVSGFVEATDGTYTATITSTLIGTKPVTVTLAGAPVVAAATANTDAVFIAGEVDLGHARTAFSVSGGEVSTDTGMHSVTVTLADRFGNPVAGEAGALASATADDLGAGGVGSFVETALVPGEYTAEVTSTVAGEKLMTASHSGDEIRLLAGGNDIARFISGGVDPSHAGTTYTVSEGEQVVGIDPHTITATLVDRNGNPVSGQEAGLSAATVASLGTGSIGTFTETGVAGTYLAEVTSTNAGTKPITARFGGTELKAKGNTDAVFVADDVDLGHVGTGYSVTGGEQIVGTGAHTVTVTLVDRFANPISGQEAELAAAAADLGSGSITGFTAGATAGSYVAEVTSTVIGDKQVTAEFSGQPIQAGPTVNTLARFVAGPVDPTGVTTWFNVSDGTRIVGEGWHTISVLLSDEYGNPVSGASSELAARVTSPIGLGSGSIAQFMETANAGWYSAVVTSTIAGDKTLAVNVSGAPVAASGNDIARFIAGEVDFGNAGTALEVTTGDQPVGTGVHTVTVTLADRFGNPVPGLAGDILGAADGDLGIGSVTSFTETGTVGTYTATVTSSISGAKLMSATIAGETVPVRGTANAHARFVAGAIDFGHDGTGFTVSEGDRVAGGDTHQVSITLADEYGNPVGHQAADTEWATADSLGTAQISAVTETSTLGSYQAPIASSEPGEKTITVSVAGQQVTAAGNDIARFVAKVQPEPPVVAPSEGGEPTGLASSGAQLTPLVGATLALLLVGGLLLLASKRRKNAVEETETQ